MFTHDDGGLLFFYCMAGTASQVDLIFAHFLTEVCIPPVVFSPPPCFAMNHTLASLYEQPLCAGMDYGAIGWDGIWMDIG